MAGASRLPQAEKGKLIQVALPAERYREASFNFKIPLWDNLAASANRLLKFEFPAIRQAKVYERLIKTNVISAGLSKKVLETLPLPSLEHIYRELWQACCGRAESPLNGWITLYLLLEEMSEFDPEQMLLQDIEQLGLRDTGTMPSYYYEGPLNREHMITFLAGHGYQTDFLTGLSEPVTDSDLQLAYFACRRLSAPLPWMELLACMNSFELGKYARLARLNAIATILRKQDWVNHQSVTVQNLLSGAAQLASLLQEDQISVVATQLDMARPVKTLVIVEGETEKLLLPLFANALGQNFNTLGIELIPAGGKNHVLSLYKENARVLQIPICVILDSDAAEIAAELQADCRPQDCIFQIEEGEFEDLYDLALTLKTINRHYQPYPEVTPSRFQELAEANQAKGRVQALKALWQSYNLGSFDKIEFAGKYADTITPTSKSKAPPQPPIAIRKLIETILAVHAGKG
jgi:hypothetical protein